MNAERLLGSLLLGGLGRGTTLRRDPRVALGVGVVALAMAAYEHFVGQRQGGATPMPLDRGISPPSPPTPAPPAPSTADTDGALLLVRAMIAAAAADGVIDAEERAAILERLAGSGLGEDERSFIARELGEPPAREAIVAEVTSPQLAEQVYAVSLMTARVDNEAERAYLRALAGDLALSVETVDRLHGALGA